MAFNFYILLETEFLEQIGIPLLCFTNFELVLLDDFVFTLSLDIPSLLF